MFTAFTSTETERVKKGIRRRSAYFHCKRRTELPPERQNAKSAISSNVNSKADLSNKTYKEPVDLSAY